MGAHAEPLNLPEPPRELDRLPLVDNQRGLGWISDRVA
jgi:hypothetical protein